MAASRARANCPLTSSRFHQQHAEEEITKPIDKSPSQRKHSLPPGKAILMPASPARANCPLTSSRFHQQHAEEEITKPIDKSPPPEDALAAAWKGDSHFASPAHANCPLTSSLLHQQHDQAEIAKPIDKSPPQRKHVTNKTKTSLPPGKAILMPASPARANCPLTSSRFHQQHAEEEITKPIDKSPPPEDARDQQDKSLAAAWKGDSHFASPAHANCPLTSSLLHQQHDQAEITKPIDKSPPQRKHSLPPGKAILIPASPARANCPLTSSLLHQQHAEEEITKPIDKSPPPEEARDQQDKSRQRKHHSGIRSPDSAVYTSLLYSCSRCHLERRFSSLQAQHAPTAL
ncbi:hypothetical protein ISCGN_031596 [Ixodes scapularis]